MGNQAQHIFQRYFASESTSVEHCRIQVDIRERDSVDDEKIIFLRFFERLSTPSIAIEAPRVEVKKEAIPAEKPIDVVKPIVELKPIVEPKSIVEPEPIAVDVLVPETKESVFRRIKKGLGRTRAGFSDGLADLLLGKKVIDDDLLEEIETQLLVADVGIEATTRIVSNLTKKVSRKELADSDALYESLQTELKQILIVDNDPGFLERKSTNPQVLLVVGVNGVGKTTTIGKLAKRLQSEGKSVMLAAGDTFRAAAVEQLQVWGERNQIPVVAQHTGADSASVIFDALASAKAKGVDVLIADTAGRLHTKSNLMEELKKVKRVMSKLDETAPHEVMLVLDAGTGQNALSQAQQFHQTMALTGITLTKLDGTAKGGIVFAIADKMNIPIRFIGVGEQIDDLRPFEADNFVKALFDKE